MHPCSPHIEPDEEAVVRREASVVPIIIVPGIMGSRLVENGSNIWNPRKAQHPIDEPGWFACDTSRLYDHRPLEVGEGSTGWARGTARDTYHRRFGAPLGDGHLGSLYNLLYDYRALADGLVDRWDALPAGVEPHVFCCGYDFRLGNANSAQRLRQVVTHALSVTGAEKVIIIAHSMGGLVSRHFSANGGENQILAMFLLGSPSLGAPEPFCLVKDGELNAAALQTLLGRTDVGVRDLVRQFASSYELMPSPVYCAQNPNWLTFNTARTGQDPDSNRHLRGFTNGADASKVYSDIYTGVTEGIIGHTRRDDFPERRAARAAAGQMAASAIAFHNSVTRDGRCYVHPRTYYCYSTAHATTETVDLDSNVFPVTLDDGSTWMLTNVIYHFYTAPVTRHTGPGDESVPEMSAAPPTSITTRVDVSADVGRTRYSGALSTHGELPAKPEIINYLRERIAIEWEESGLAGP